MSARELEAAIVAARHAASQHAHRTALHLFDRARELLPADDLPRRFELLADRLITLDMLGEREAQSRAIEELSALAEALDDDERRVTAQYRRAELETRLGRSAECAACCRAALALAEGLGSAAWRVRLLVLWAFALLELRLLDEALARIGEAEAIAAAAGLPENETRVLGRKA